MEVLSLNKDIMRVNEAHRERENGRPNVACNKSAQCNRCTEYLVVSTRYIRSI